MKRYPLKLTYVTKTALWAGTALRDFWGKKSELATISESWELTVRPKEMATVIGGVADGMTLLDYLRAAGNDAVSPTWDGEHFPLLIKLIDADDTLSVQVHPDDDYAASVENDMGKTEMWYIVDCKEGAELVYGLCDGVDRQAFADAVRAGNVASVMKRVPVQKGQTYFIPAGMLHAIGAGILIAEIQQNSDLTYRVYDYDRRQADGTLRALHVDKAIDVTRPFTEEEVDAIRFSRGKSDPTLLANSRYFSVRRITVDGAIEACVGKESFTALLCLEGEGKLTHDNVDYPIRKGETYFLPANMGAYTVEGKDLTLLTSQV